MLGLRFFGCSRCGTVFAAPEEPVACAECSDGDIEELTDDLRADAYFTRAGRP